jgi:flagellar biosynthetic protein FliP
MIPQVLQNSMSSSRHAVLGCFFAVVGAVFCILPDEAVAQSLPLVSSTTTGGTTEFSVPVQTLLTLTALSFLPAALVLMTSFTRIIIVFALLKQALGLQTAPPNIVLVGLALFLTLFIMSPIFDEIYRSSYVPLANGSIGFEQAVESAGKPLKLFMLNNTGTDELRLFSNLYPNGPVERENVPFQVLVPAFAMSEIKAGFIIGFLIYLPFIAIDLAVASVLTSLGMIMVSPMMFSLPVKLIIFVLADGWTLLGASLIASFSPPPS